MRSSLTLALALALALPGGARSQEPPGVELVERIVAVLDERPLLLSDVRVVMAVRGVGEREALEAAIDEELMYREAARLPQASVSPDEEDRELARVSEATPALGKAVDEPALRRLLRRQIAILKYVEFRFRPQVRVSDEDVRRAWEQERAGQPAGPALEDEQSGIRDRLERRALDERIEAWVSELRSRADVRYVGPLPPPTGP